MSFSPVKLFSVFVFEEETLPKSPSLLSTLGKMSKLLSTSSVPYLFCQWLQSYAQSYLAALSGVLLAFIPQFSNVLNLN